MIKNQQKNIQESSGNDGEIIQTKIQKKYFRGPDIQGKIEDEKKLKWSK